MSSKILVNFADAPFEIIDGDRGKNYPKQNDFFSKGHCLFLNAGNVTKSGFNFSNCQFISEEKDALLRKGKLQQNDVVLTTRGTVGNSAYFNEHIVFDNIRINSGMVIFRCNENDIIPSYLYFFLRSSNFYAQVNSLKSGVAQPQLPIRDIKRIKIPLPSLPEQKKISEFLTTYDDLIENNRRRIQLLEESARLIYREWFVRLRFPGHEHVKVVDGVPEGWSQRPVPDVIQVKPKEKVEKDKKIRYIPMSCLSESGMTINHSGIEERKKSTSVKFRNGDVLFARITPCLENGKTGYVNILESGELACGSTEFIVLRGKKVSSYYTYCLSRTYDFRENAIKSMIGSSGRQRVQESCFEEYLVYEPPKHIKSLFDENVGTIFHQIKKLSEQNYVLAQARDILLPRLMNGEITL